MKTTTEHQGDPDPRDASRASPVLIVFCILAVVVALGGFFWVRAHHDVIGAGGVVAYVVIGGAVGIGLVAFALIRYPRREKPPEGDPVRRSE